MHLSTNHVVQKAKVTTGFEYLEFDTLAEFKAIVTNDHSPAQFDKGIRLGGNVITCDMVVMDVDNTEEPYVSIDDFMDTFKDAHFYLATSKSHQKEKHSGQKVCPPADRYHVYFPLKRGMFAHEYKYIATQLCENFPFFDPACKDAGRFFYGNPDTQVFINSGKLLDIEPPKPQIELAPPDDKPTASVESSADFKARIFSALQVASLKGAFDSRDKWITLGMAMKRDGFSVNDWIALSWANIDQRYVQHCWNGFSESGAVSGKSLTYMAKEFAPDIMRPNSLTIQSNRLKSDNRGHELTVNQYQFPKPSHMEDQVSRELATSRKAGLYFEVEDEETGKMVIKLAEDWYFRIIDLDPDIANCIHYDYTMGTKLIAYHNTDILRNALLQRLRAYVGVSRISRIVLERMMDQIMSINMNRNQVAERIDWLKSKYPIDESKPSGWELDEFLNLMEFTNIQGSSYSNAELRQIYKEVWHLFFLRMHMHIDGTRIVNGGFKCLMENDIIPILQGPQGIGKTTLVNYIAMNDPLLYIDLGSGQKAGFGDASTQKMCRGKMIGELGEMKLMRKSDDVETIKSFISKKQYEIDVKFVEHTKPLPVTISFIGTANMYEYLSDTTGNRRWWPVWLKSIDMERIADNPDLIKSLHAHYARLVQDINPDERYLHLRQSDALKKYLAEARSHAMICYSDKEAVMEAVSKDFVEQSNSDSNHNKKYHRLQNFEVEKLVYIASPNIRVKMSAIQDAMTVLGYERTSYSKMGRSVYGWSKRFENVMEY